MIGERVNLSDLRPLAAPTKDQAHVWWCSVDDFVPSVDKLNSVLLPVEQDQAARFVSIEARHRFVVGRSILRMLLSDYLAMPESKIEIEIGRFGKPHLAATPAPKLSFNVAHSGDWVLIGVTTGGEIGVDIERHRPFAHYQSIADRHFSDRERIALQALNAEEQQELFFHIWTRKEAALKWHGAGLHLPLSSFDVPLKRRCHEWLELPALGERCWVESIDAPAGYSAAIATSHAVVALNIRNAAGMLHTSKLEE